MALNNEYCEAREEYCVAMHKVLDRIAAVHEKGITQKLIDHVIVQSGIPKPHTPDNFEDIIGENISDFINKLFKKDRLLGCHRLINNAQDSAPTPSEVGGDKTWNDMQHVIHDGPEQSVGLIAQYLPDDDAVKQEYMSAQANYHQVYSSVEKAANDITALVMQVADDIPDVALPLVNNVAHIDEDEADRGMEIGV